MLIAQPERSHSALVVDCLSASPILAPMRQRKRQPSLSLNITDFVQGLYSVLGGHRLWCSEVSGRPRKYEHKKCPELLLGRLSPPLERTALLCLAVAKVSKNPGTAKRFRDFLHLFRQSISFVYSARGVLFTWCFHASTTASTASATTVAIWKKYIVYIASIYFVFFCQCQTVRSREGRG